MPLQMTRGRGRKRQQYMHQQGSLQCPPVSKSIFLNKKKIGLERIEQFHEISTK
jgi:hypothetical protein